MGLRRIEMAKVKIDKVVIFGAGRMGSTIAITMAQAGIKVTMRSRKDGNKIFTFTVLSFSFLHLLINIL